MPVPEATERTRYVLYPLPDTALEKTEHAKHRAQRRGAATLSVVMWVATAVAIGKLAFEIATGDPGDIVWEALLPLYSGALAVHLTAGGVGARGRYHLKNPMVCAVHIEDAERERYGYGSGALKPIGTNGVELGEDTCEYMRLSALADQVAVHALDVRERLEALAEERDDAASGAGEDVASDPHVE